MPASKQAGTPQASWRPAVTSVSADGNGSYHLAGTLKDSAGDVYYARSFNFSTMAPSTPGEAESADFTLPSGLPHGTYSLYVSACGVSSSTGYSFTY